MDYPRKALKVVKLFLLRLFRPSSFQESGTGFTVLELLVMIGIIGMAIVLLVPIFSAMREKGRTIKCVNNLHQITHSMSLYKVHYTRYPNDPVDNFSLLLGWVKDITVFACPSTAKEILMQSDVNGNTSYRYFGTRNDLKYKGLGATQAGSSFVPSDPGRGWDERYKFGAAYDRSFSNHVDNCINVIYLDDDHWEPMCSAGPICGEITFALTSLDTVIAAARDAANAALLSGTQEAANGAARAANALAARASVVAEEISIMAAILNDNAINVHAENVRNHLVNVRDRAAAATAAADLGDVNGAATNTLAAAGQGQSISSQGQAALNRAANLGYCPGGGGAKGGAKGKG